ncbi:MAG: peptide chain release factor H [Bacteroidales bacterium]|nr:peptide chain release factor H [Bacteroidales bacterium]MCF8455334.1 peptide chain release factor H [Bacteroidales bacterium]
MTQILQITSGNGPVESTWVVAQILKILMDEARGKGIETTVLHREEGEENGALLSASIQLEAAHLDEFVKSWAGTVQWNGESQLKRDLKSKSWFVGIQKIELAEEEFQISEKDIAYQAIRASGPGGQHVNKVSTAIRATHTPTGLSVVASDSRSQIQNRKKAKERLLNMLKIETLNRKQEHLKSVQHNQKLDRANPVRVFTGSDFKPPIENKKFKSQRQTLKSELRKRLAEDE